jgi:hypothetical protein
MPTIDQITLEVMKNAFSSITEEMGAALVRSAYSTNIKDRKDFSCALYTAEGHAHPSPFGSDGLRDERNVKRILPGGILPRRHGDHE